MKTLHLLVALFRLSAGARAWAASEADRRRLLDANPPDTRITSAMARAGNSFAPPGAAGTMRHPAFCRAAGVAEPPAYSHPAESGAARIDSSRGLDCR